MIDKIPESPRSVGEKVYKNSSLDRASAFQQSGNTKTNPIDQLHPSAARDFRRAVTQYQNDPNARLTTISINSGRRNVWKQLELYRKFLWWKLDGEASDTRVAAANLPGTSYHEYGLATDVISRRDRQLISEKMNANGWEDNKPEEPWHFEYTAITTRSGFQSFVRTTRQTYSLQAYDRLKKAHGVEKKRDRQRLVLEEATLEASEFRSSLVLRRKRLEKQEDKLSSLKDELSANELATQELKSQQSKKISELSRFTYDLCPNGNAYDACGHHELKSEFDRQKSLLQAAVDGLSTAVAASVASRGKVESRLRAIQRVFRLGLRKFREDIDRLEEMHSYVRQQNEKLLGHEIALQEIEVEISALVEKISQRTATVQFD